MSNLGPQFNGITINHPIAGPVKISRETEGEFGIEPRGGHALTATYHHEFASKYGGVKGLQDYTGMHPEEFIEHVDHHISRLTEHGPWKSQDDELD